MGNISSKMELIEIKYLIDLIQQFSTIKKEFC
jgi:hypothetical protein